MTIGLAVKQLTIGASIGDAIKRAATRRSEQQSLREALESGVVLVRYRKVTTGGGNRFALATLQPKYYAGYTFKGGTSPTEYGLEVYWDLRKQMWRSFYPFNVESWSKVR